jgi:hypothetical protein
MTMNARRRKILLTSLAILFSTSAVTAQARIPNAVLEATKTEVDETLFVAALDFIKRRYIQHDRPIVYGPVSRLQREFLLGYRAGRELVAVLEAANVWQISIKLETQIATINLESPHLRC